MDSDNPFAKLNKKIFNKKPRLKKTFQKKEKNREDDSSQEDSLLFLEAMSSVKSDQKNSYNEKYTPDLFDNTINFVKPSSVSSIDERPLKKEVPMAKPKPIHSDEEALFYDAVENVEPLSGRGRDLPKASLEKKAINGKSASEMMQEVLEGRVEFTLSQKNEYIEGHVVGVDPAIMAKLRAGTFSPESHVDLHGQNSRQAFDSLLSFIKSAYLRNTRTVTVITGRGKNSPLGISILRNELQIWLTKNPFKRVVLAFCSAQPWDGGVGAVYVLLRKNKKQRGKIRWDVPYQDFDEL